jgi:hypothetical protein
MICDLVVDCLGNVLTVIQAYPDGSYNCPGCGYGVQTHEPHCQNPMCFTRPSYPPEHARAAIAAELERKRAEAERERAHAANMRAHEEYRRDRDVALAQALAEAKRKGACPTCALYSFRHGFVKFIKHRKACPRC